MVDPFIEYSDIKIAQSFRINGPWSDFIRFFLIECWRCSKTQTEPKCHNIWHPLDYRQELDKLHSLLLKEIINFTRILCCLASNAGEDIIFNPVFLEEL